VRIAEHDLHGVEHTGTRDIGKIRDRDIAGERRVVVFGHQAAVNFGHAVQVRAGVLDIAAARELVAEAAANLHRPFHRSGAVRIDAERVRVAKFLTKRANRRNFDIRWQHAAFQLDLAETVAGDHLFGFADGGGGGEDLTVFIFTAIVAQAAATRLFIKEIRGKRHGIADPAADDVTHRLADGFADDVEACDFDRGEGSGVLVEGIFARDEIGLAAVSGTRNRLIHLPIETGELKRIHAGDAGANGFERGDGTIAAVGFTDADDAIIRSSTRRSCLKRTERVIRTNCANEDRQS
jgi:hypothetical protein